MVYDLQLRKIRKTKGMTQAELAREIGTTDRVVGAWERGETGLTLEDACDVARALGCTPNDLCGWPNEAGGYIDERQADVNRWYEECGEAQRAFIAQCARNARDAEKSEEARRDSLRPDQRKAV